MKPLELPEKPFLKEFKSQRLIFRLSQIGHAPALWQAIKRDRDSESTAWPEIQTLEQTKEYIRKKSQKNPGPEMTYFLFNKKSELMGSVHLHTFSYYDHKVEIGYWILKPYQGTGLASEAVARIEKELLRLGFHRIEIRCNPRNLASVKVAKKNHYLHEGTLRQDTRVEGGFLDTAVYGKVIGHDECYDIDED